MPPWIPVSAFAGAGAVALARLNDEITCQALMIGYIDVFYLTTWTSFLGLPLILLLARAK